MKAYQLTKWQDITELLENIPAHKDCILPRWIYRGQSSSLWNLIPSILRKGIKYKFEKKKLLGCERMSMLEFQQKYRNYIDLRLPDEAINNPIIFLSIMQHYYCPTRLLDWTESPYVGLFFAVEDRFDEDGALFLFNSTLLDKINEEDRIPQKKIPNNELFDFEGMNLLYPFYTVIQNNRAILQRGLFTFSTNIELDHTQLIDETFKIRDIENCFIKIVIPGNLKLEFLSRLMTMNITRSTLFGDLDGLGRHIGHLMDLRSFLETKK
jgi:FRG domain